MRNELFIQEESSSDSDEYEDLLPAGSEQKPRLAAPSYSTLAFRSHASTTLINTDETRRLRPSLYSIPNRPLSTSVMSAEPEPSRAPAAAAPSSWPSPSIYSCATNPTALNLAHFPSIPESLSALPNGVLPPPSFIERHGKALNASLAPAPLFNSSSPSADPAAAAKVRDRYLAELTRVPRPRLSEKASRIWKEIGEEQRRHRLYAPYPRRQRSIESVIEGLWKELEWEMQRYPLQELPSKQQAAPGEPSLMDIHPAFRPRISEVAEATEEEQFSEPEPERVREKQEEVEYVENDVASLPDDNWSITYRDPLSRRFPPPRTALPPIPPRPRRIEERSSDRSRLVVKNPIANPHWSQLEIYDELMNDIDAQPWI